MKDEKPPKNGTDVKTYAVIALGCSIGLSAVFCVVAAVNGYWIEFGICLAIAVVLFIVTCPLAYEGDVYECPHCGRKFRVNFYIVLFTNGKLKTSDDNGEQVKYAKLKCSDCGTKDLCKRL